MDSTGRTRSLRPALVGLLLVAIAVAAPPARGADPFYERALVDGSAASARGDHDTAAKLLRIACFGLLDEPQRLAEGLARLAISQDAIRDGDGYRETFDRLLQVEARFGAYRGLPPALIGAFEETVPRHIAEAELLRTPLFAALAERRAELRLRQLPPKERRRELERRLAEAPADIDRMLALARFEMEERRWRRARELTARAAAAAPDNSEARCLNGRAGANDGQCATAVGEFAACPRAVRDATLALPWLECLVRLDEWSGAAELLTRMPADIRQLPPVARLAARVPPEQTAAVGPGAGESEPMSAPGVAGRPPGGSEPAAPAAVAGPTLNAEERAELERIRLEITRTTDGARLEALLTAARRLADEHSREPLAQIAVAEAAYRTSRWETAAEYFERAGVATAEQPLYTFYLAVSLFESGRFEEAAARLEEALPFLARTPFVERYIERIRGGGDS